MIFNQEYDIEPREEESGEGEDEVVIMLARGSGVIPGKDLQSASMDSLNSYEKATMRNSNRLLDKSVSAYSLPRVDEGNGLFLFFNL